MIHHVEFLEICTRDRVTSHVSVFRCRFFLCSVFFIYNIYNNYIINNKNDEINFFKNTNISASLSVARCKNVTGSIFFIFFYFSVFFKKKTERRQWEWRFFHWRQTKGECAGHKKIYATGSVAL
jgi:hypothetical protein